MTGNIHDNRAIFDSQVQDIFSDLPADSKTALVRTLKVFREYAIAQAEVSRRKNKHMMYAYWRVCGVYAGQMARVIKKM